MKLGTTEITKGYLGSTEITKAYLGNNVVFSSAPVGVDIFPSGNAASVGTNEGTAFSNIVSNSGTLSNSTDRIDGAYSLSVVSAVATSSIEPQFSFTAGTSYVITFWAKRTIGSLTTASVYTFSPFSASTSKKLTIDSASWKEYTFTQVANATGTGILRVYSSFSGAIGDAILLDKFSIIEIN